MCVCVSVYVCVCLQSTYYLNSPHSTTYHRHSHSPNYLCHPHSNPPKSPTTVTPTQKRGPVKEGLTTNWGLPYFNVGENGLNNLPPDYTHTSADDTPPALLPSSLKDEDWAVQDAELFRVGGVVNSYGWIPPMVKGDYATFQWAQETYFRKGPPPQLGPNVTQLAYSEQQVGRWVGGWVDMDE